MAILDMRLHQLTGLAIEDLQTEYDELKKLIDYLKSLLASREMRLGVIKDELLEVKEKHNNPRRTEITIDDSDINISDLIARHSCVITVSNTGYVKRVPSDTYRTQHRGGKGIMGMETKDEDHVEHLFNADSHDLIFFITDKGFMHWLNVYEIPEASRTSKGKAIVNMIKIESGEQIKAMITTTKEDLERDDLFLMMATKNGYIKKTPLSAFKNLRRAGIRALNIEDEDDLIAADITTGENEVLISTAKGMACRFDEKDVRPMGRTSRGVTSMRFKIDGDYIVSMEVVAHLEDVETDEEAETQGGPQILVVSNGGMGKRSYVSTYRRTRRGAKGVTSIRLRDNEIVVAAIQIHKGDELLITTEQGQIVRIPADEIRTIGRASKGVKIMNMKKDGDRITGVSRIVKVDGDDDDNGEEGEVSEENATVTNGEANVPVENGAEGEPSSDASENEAEETEDED
jgi:DNA gyrase subunit A